MNIRKIVVVAVSISLLLVPRLSSAMPVPPGLDKCPTLSACLALLDEVVPANDTGEGNNAETITRDLRRFGEPAKQELLGRAAGSHAGWRNAAGAILRNWGSWQPSDVPALRAALQKQHGGWVARPLAEIATPDAISALAEDLSTLSYTGNQTGFALTKVGAKAVPFLFPLLQTDQSAYAAADVIRQIGQAALPYLPQWKTLALDDKEPIQKRIAALRAIAALESLARNGCEDLRPLLNSPDQSLQHQAELTLHDVRDPILLPKVVSTCEPKADAFDSWANDARRCLVDIASYGTDAGKVGARLLPFLASRNAVERSYGIVALGIARYAGATEAIRHALDDPDWRVVYLAARSLGWLGAEQALPDLDRISSTHWLPEVREMAKRSATAIRSPAGRTEVPLDWVHLELSSWAVDSSALRDRDACSSGRWEWEKERFSLARDRSPRHKGNSILSFQDGKLVGSNFGEHGGSLSWRPESGESIEIINFNVVAILRDGEDAVAILGLAHMGFDDGYAVSLARRAAGSWTVTRTMQLLARPEAVAALKNGRFAVLNADRAVVLSSGEGILGLANCE